MNSSIMSAAGQVWKIKCFLQTRKSCMPSFVVRAVNYFLKFSHDNILSYSGDEFAYVNHHSSSFCIILIKNPISETYRGHPRAFGRNPNHEASHLSSCLSSFWVFVVAGLEEVVMAVSGSGRSERLCEKVCIKFPFPLIVWRAGLAPHAVILLGFGSWRKGVTHTSQTLKTRFPLRLQPLCSYKMPFNNPVT